MGFPSEKELKRIRKELENVEGTRVVGSEGSKVERFKFSLCQKFVIFFKSCGMTQKEFAIFLSIDEALVSKLLNCKVEVFTIDRLLRLIEIIHPDYHIEFAS